MRSRPAFQAFFAAHRTKVVSKLRSTDDPDELGDRLAELEFAYCAAADCQVRLRYEPYGLGESEPDFQVEYESALPFVVEVKRIRPSETSSKLRRCLDTIMTALKEVPSKMGVEIVAEEFDETVDFVNRLAGDLPGVVAVCVELLHQAASDTNPPPSQKIPVPGFEQQLHLSISLLPNSWMGTGTANFGTPAPIPYNQREYRKFGDLVAGCLRQLKDGQHNVLAIKIDSDTHEKLELGFAISQLLELVKSSDDQFFRKKGFVAAADFLVQFAKLSGVAARSIWGPLAYQPSMGKVWRNPVAKMALPDSIESLLLRTWVNV